ncbi:MAG: GNAT family N-acetyltransferase [Clostridiaceae bacterium]|nr:GNAT family N-acetyltransferase [Clostridiaceae bacterium]
MLDKTLPNISVMLETHRASEYPRYPVPDGYTLSGYREGFDRAWARIECAAEGMRSMDYAVGIFHREFGYDPDMARTNCLFLLDAGGVPVSTASLWTGNHTGVPQPRLHYVATDPAHEGKGLCKALLTAIFDLQAAQHRGEYMYLTSQPGSFQAIRLYMRFGFTPYLGPRPVNWQHPDFETDTPRAWRIIQDKIAEFEHEGANNRV